MDKYTKAGVDIVAGEDFVDNIKKINNKKIKGPLADNIGWFAGGFDLSLFDYKKPVIFSSNDGVGTKLLLGLQNKKLATIGQDLVAMCVNDLICHGAKPLFFLDYIGTHSVDSKIFSALIKNIVEVLNDFNASLLGGETAEMRDMYQDGEFDLCGMAMGVAEKDQIINPKNVKNGDVIIGITSNGFHSNGYSLVRQIISSHKVDLNKVYFGKKPLIDVLMQPTRIYVNPIMNIASKISIHAAAHITGGGIEGNIKRILNQNQKAIINMKEINILPEMKFLQKLDNISDSEMVKVFNMGIGFCLAVSKEDELKTLKLIKDNKLVGKTIGEITSGNGVDIRWD